MRNTWSMHAKAESAGVLARVCTPMDRLAPRHTLFIGQRERERERESEREGEREKERERKREREREM
jgi:hypothetical protein